VCVCEGVGDREVRAPYIVSVCVCVCEGVGDRER
jgi:bacterioferritin-associated ferredoxin